MKTWSLIFLEKNKTTFRKDFEIKWFCFMCVNEVLILSINFGFFLLESFDRIIFSQS